MPNRLDPLGANASDPGILTSDGRGAERQAFIQFVWRAISSPVQSPRHRSREGIARGERVLCAAGRVPQLEAADVACAGFAFAI